MMSMHRSGLEDVVVGESAITWIDGQTGELRYRGYSIDDLAETTTFEEVAFLLWFGELPTRAQLSDFQDQIGLERTARTDLVRTLVDIPPAAHPLDVLRYVVSWDAINHQETWDNHSLANQRKAIQFLAWFPVIVGALHRMREGKDIVPPDPSLSTAGTLLHMASGRLPDPLEVRALDMAFVLQADHEFNASTFAARVTIATQSTLHAAVASALGTLSGPRHGGASDGVIHMLEQIGTPDRVETWVRERLASRERVMGFGHRLYRTVDPRARHLQRLAEEMLAGTGREAWIELVRKLAEVMARERNLYPNVDLYVAIVDHELGMHPTFYTSLFACSRIVGWTAHAMEQIHGRMIRPTARYVGPAPRRPVEEPTRT